MNPFDYSLCDRTVTVYRNENGKITRQVAENCHLWETVSTPMESGGKSMEKTFRLIIPGDFPLRPGDRVYGGIGPETVDWQRFLPALVPQVYEIGAVRPCFWDGELTHWEAASGKERM